MEKIVAKYKLFGGLGLFIFITVFIVYLFYDIYKEPFAFDHNHITIFIMLILWVLFFSTQIRHIIIKNNSITLANIFLPFIRKTKSFDYFDYYVLVGEFAVQGNYESIWLIKNDKLKYRISSFYYSNYEEIKKNIKIKNNGKLVIDPITQILYTFGKKINNKKQNEIFVKTIEAIIISILGVLIFAVAMKKIL